MRRVTLAAAVAAGCLGYSSLALAGFAIRPVVSYDKGSATSFTDPNAATGSLAGVTGSGKFTGVVSPFYPAYNPDQIVVIGDGGHLTLQMDKPINVKPGPQLGVFSNVGFIDASYPNGIVTSPATYFGGGSADVQVSANGKTYVDLGTITFNIPTNHYLNAGFFDTKKPDSPKVADSSKPFTGTLASFAGENSAQVLATLNGTAGGTWIDLSKSGLSTVDFVKFIEPKLNDPTHYLAIDALTTAGSGPGVPSSVPVPPAALLVLGAVPMLRRAMRKTC